MAAIFFSGQATTFGAIAPGLWFATELRGKTYIGLKVKDAAAASATDACVILGPAAGEGPGYLAVPPASEAPVLALPEAMVQPSLDPAQIQADGAAAREPGMLLLVGERWLLAVSDENGTALVDIGSGTPVRGPKETGGLCFRSWRLVQKGLGDEYETICRHVVKRQSTVGFARG